MGSSIYQYSLFLQLSTSQDAFKPINFNFIQFYTCSPIILRLLATKLISLIITL
jgi:hypothetical protein